ncbi:MAG TPA: DUF421 domain-containing protein [Oscillospiraceae bacterium]|nr:DUF421 domain-containing protein [Oscillospiraceae bacterium]HPS35199.1 DUF421 domain-containing protein [Oscillospiraceae bacterium]
MREILKAAGTALIASVVLFALTRLMGKRQISQLGVFDYINGITIGSIAAELAVSGFKEFEVPLTAMIVFGLVPILTSYLTDKSIWIRKIITGKPAILFDGGKFLMENFKHARIDINEFLCRVRSAGYFDLSDIQTALLEPNGEISFLPAADKRPLTPQDMNLKPPQDTLKVELIIDGKILYKNLGEIGKDEQWLMQELKKLNAASVIMIALATCDRNDNVCVFLKDRI